MVAIHGHHLHRVFGGGVYLEEHQALRGTMTVYYIKRTHVGLPDLEVEYEGDPPCLWCGEPVPSPGSMDGPLVSRGHVVHDAHVGARCRS